MAKIGLRKKKRMTINDTDNVSVLLILLKYFAWNASNSFIICPFGIS